MSQEDRFEARIAFQFAFALHFQSKINKKGFS